MYKFKASFKNISGKINNRYLKISTAPLNLTPNIKPIRLGDKKYISALVKTARTDIAQASRHMFFFTMRSSLNLYTNKGANDAAIIDAIAVTLVKS